MTAEDLLWPGLRRPEDLDAVERVPLGDRGLPPTTWAIVERAAARWPDRPALAMLPSAERWQDSVQLTFGELGRRVAQVANVFAGLGVRRTDGVALLSPNCLELLVATLAAQAAGIVAPVNPGLAVEHLGQLLRRSGASVLVAAGPELDPLVWETARSVASDLGLHSLLAVRPTGATGPAPDLEPLAGVTVAYLGELADREPTSLAVVPPQGPDLAGLFHTGGTTGTPKLAAHTHTNEVVDAWALADSSVLTEDDVTFAALPLFHVNALVVTLLGPLLRGRQVVWAGPLGYREPALYGCFWKLVERYRVAAMSGVPTVYSVLAQRPVDADISSLRVAAVGASPLPPAVREAFERHTGVRLNEGYGLTEATCASTRNFAGRPRVGSVGQRLPYHRMKAVTVDEAGRWTDQPAGAPGLLVVSGPTVFAGYVVGRTDDGLQLDGLGKVVDGWLDTGDLGRVEADGYVYLTGRAKDLIIRGGHNIDPATIEDALLAHPEVTGASAVGRPDRQVGEVPVAYVTVRPGAQTSGAELASWAAERVSERAAAPKEVVVVEALPVTAVGKPYKVALRERAAVAAAEAEVERLSLDPRRAGVTCFTEDGGLVLELLRPDDDAAASALADVLDQYTWRWRWAA